MKSLGTSSKKHKFISQFIYRSAGQCSDSPIYNVAPESIHKSGSYCLISGNDIVERGLSSSSTIITATALSGEKAINQPCCREKVQR